MSMAASGSSAVDTFLEQIDLTKYRESFQSQGYDTAFDLCVLADKDLDSLGIVDREERAKILSAAAELDIRLWLGDLGLERYFDEFTEQRIDNVKDLKTAPELTDELLRDTFRIAVPGHRNRIKWAVKHLKGYSAQEHVTAQVVVLGYWGKPPEMKESKHQFLIVPGYLKSDKGEDALSSELIQFTVDSGSEVSVTATEQLISELKLDYLQNIESRGVHAVADKPTYKGVLKLGKEEIEVEVMPDQFSTVGGTVIKQFKHYIDGTSHRWLKDDD